MRLSKIERGALLEQVGRFLHTLVDPVMRRLREHEGGRMMLQLDDHLLRDIGLSRSELHAAACGIVPLRRAEAAQESATRPARHSRGTAGLTPRQGLWHIVQNRDAVEIFSCIGDE